ncbi:MAG: amidohydrolase family protein [Saprospiraceae bacterium]|nr:amidohydrolase family protein [Saprospiraceae bacterium]
MKFIKRTFLVLLSLLVLLVITAAVIIWMDNLSTNYLSIDKDDTSTRNTYLLTNVHVIPMHEDTVLANKMVLIKDGIIAEVADHIEAPGVEVLDGLQKYLAPGLIDMHVHVWDEYELGVYLANGVTAIRNVWGMPMHLRMKDAINKEEMYAPAFFTTGPKLTGREFIGDDNLNLSNPEEAAAKVASYKERGYDFIKTYYGLEPDLFDAIITQAEKSDMDIVAHPSQKVPFSYHTNPQIKSIEHAEEITQTALQFDLDTQKLQLVIDTIAAASHLSYCPTMVVFNNIYQMLMHDDMLASGDLLYINPLIRKVDSENQFNRWSNAKREDPQVVDRIKAQHDFHLLVVQKLHDAGVNVICGTDAGIGVTPPGSSIHKELAFYKEAGLSNYEVLQTATVNAAKTHAIMHSLGTIEKGKVANLLLLENNPLESLSTLRNPSVVFINGRKLDRKTLDGFNEKAANRENLIASGFRYLENLVVEK